MNYFKLFTIVLLSTTLTFAQQVRSGGGTRTLNFLDVPDSIRQMVGDSVTALSADGVTIANNTGTFGQKVFANVAALEAATGSDGQIASVDGQLYLQVDSADVFSTFGISVTDDPMILDNGGTGKRWVALDFWYRNKFQDTNRFKIHWLNSQQYIAGVQKKIAGSTHAVLEFENGEYDLSAIGLADFDSLGSIYIEGNGATFTASDTILNFTTADVWNRGWNSNPAPFGTTARYDTIFAGNFSRDTSYVLIADSADWRGISRGDMIAIRDTSYIAGQGDQKTGAILFVEKITVSAGADTLWFDIPPFFNISKDSIDNVSWQDLHGKNFYMNNVNFVNTEIRVTNFENIIVTNCTNLRPFDENQVATGAFQFMNFRTLFLNNCVARGYNNDGNGYGITVGRFGTAHISNFKAYDCRHGLTTSSYLPAGIGGNFLSVVNSFYSGGHHSGIEETQTAWDTHTGVYYTEFINCDTYGFATAFNLRSDNIRLIGCDYYPRGWKATTSRPTYLNATASFQIDKTGRDKNIFISNSEMLGIDHLIQFAGTGTFNNVKLVDLKVDVVNAATFRRLIWIPSTSTDVNIDTLIVDGGEYIGSGTSYFFYLDDDAAGTSWRVNWFELKNATLRNFASGFFLKKNKVKDYRIENNKFLNFSNAVFEMTAADSATKRFKSFKSSNNEYNNCVLFFDLNNSETRLGGFSFTDDKFLKTRIALNKTVLDTVSFKDCEFNFASLTDQFNIVSGGTPRQSNAYVLFDDCQFLGDSLRTAINVPEQRASSNIQIDILNSTFKSKLWKSYPVLVRSADLNFIGNKVMVDSLTGVTSVIYYLGSYAGKANFVGNYFNIKESSTAYAVRNDNSLATVHYHANTIDCYPTASIVKGLYNRVGTLVLGKNYRSCTGGAALDTTGLGGSTSYGEF